MFDHKKIDVLKFHEIPLNRDCFLMDEIYIPEYENSLVNTLNGDEYENVGYISYIACRAINDNSIELSWYPNIHTRFHEVSVILPKDQLIVCVECWHCDEKPRLFVKSKWLEELYLKFYSVFCMIDAIGVKNALENGGLSREKLVNLREKIDKLSSCYPQISFISFADSILLKSQWTVGTYKSEISYTYKPEIFIDIILEIQEIYKNTLKLDIYAILAQGNNEYYEDSLLHISESQNHICLNSLGIPFADLLSIEDAARKSIKDKTHKPSQLYMEQKFYHSLSFKHEFNKNKQPRYHYNAKMISGNTYYYPNNFETIKSNIKKTADQPTT